MFNDPTEAAIKAFRKKNGLSELGLVDKATWGSPHAQGKSSVDRIERPWEQTLMGTVYGCGPGRGPEPRHVREFAGFVEKYLGGKWEAVKR